jgi:hypothetical protein
VESIEADQSDLHDCLPKPRWRSLTQIPEVAILSMLQQCSKDGQRVVGIFFCLLPPLVLVPGIVGPHASTRVDPAHVEQLDRACWDISGQSLEGQGAWIDV